MGVYSQNGNFAGRHTKPEIMHFKSACKASLCAGLLTFALFILCPVAEAKVNDFGNIARYAEANKQLTTPPSKGETRVVFMGNSITEGWVRLDPEFFEKNGYVGRGISGQTSYQYLYRFRRDVVDIHAGIVVINAGTNDIAENSCPYDEETTMGNIKSMVEIALANKVKVILTSTLPAARFPWSKATDAPAKIAALNRRIRAYAKEKKLPYADYFSSVVADDGYSLRKEYTSDGVHPTKAGYLVMESVIRPIIKKVIKKK